MPPFEAWKIICINGALKRVNAGSIGSITYHLDVGIELCHDGNMSEGYRVLARRLRPRLFKELVGQDVFVQLIQKAFLTKRLASGFLLTGIRGVGKTTIARLLAKTMNCKTSFEGAEWVEPCGSCTSCVAFDEGSHPDILEIDAASHTGVDDVRRILETCQYNALLGRYKVFIVDEVHMLSKSAFNALLKTLEAPPSHVKFILATTEVEKIPLTVVSRCLRFDLRRIERGVIQKYLAQVCVEEGVSGDENALYILADAADGSLRDALSMLEQALLLVHQTDGGPSVLDVNTVRSLLGLKGDGCIKDMLLAILQNDAGTAIRLARETYDDGGDPVRMVDELSDLVHQISSVNVADADDTLRLHRQDKDFLQEQAAAHSLAVWGRLWQMLLKGRKEMLDAAFAQRSLEMLLIRLAYATQLPTPDKLVIAPQRAHVQQPNPALDISTQVESKGERSSTSSRLNTPKDLLKMLKEHREGVLHAHFFKDVHVISFKEPLLEMAVNEHVPKNFSSLLHKFLCAHTGCMWQVRLVDPKDPVKSLHTQELEKEAGYHEAADNLSLVRSTKSIFGDDVVLSLKEPKLWTGDTT